MSPFDSFSQPTPGLSASKTNHKDTWNNNQLRIIAAARAHTQYITLSSFISRIQYLPITTSPALKTALSNLCSLFALSEIINPQSINAISFVEDGYLSPTQIESIRNIVDELLERSMPNAIALTDAWDFTDASLASAIGMFNGNVYETVIGWVRQLPMNRKAWEQDGGVFQPGWKEMVGPVLRGKL